MRRYIVIYLAAVALLSSCAYQGTIVEKRFRPLPFSASLGMDAMYNFQLRDSTQQIHSQMVTPDVFASYRAGDYFNDLQASAAPKDKEIEEFTPAPWEVDEGPHQPVRVMKVRPPGKTAVRVAVHSNSPVKSSANVAVSSGRSIKTRVAVHSDHSSTVAANFTVRSDRSIKSVTKAAIHSNLPIKSAARVGVHSNSSVKSAAKVAVRSNPRIKKAASVAIHSNSSIKRVANVAVHSDHSTKSGTRVAVRSNQHAKNSAKTAKSNNPGNDTSQIVHHKKKVAKVTAAHRKHHRETVASLN